MRPLEFLSEYKERTHNKTLFAGFKAGQAYDSVFSFYGRNDLLGDIDNIKSKIITQVQDKFKDIDANVKVLEMRDVLNYLLMILQTRKSWN